MGKRTKKNSAVFLDRDGTIIKERHYLRKMKDISLIKGSDKACQILQEYGYKLIIITNQSGIRRGYLTKQKLAKIHKHLLNMLKRKGVKIDGLYYCPHAPDERCGCRKPKLGLVTRAKKRFNLNLSTSYVIGDKLIDSLLGQRMGGKGVLILTGHGKKEYRNLKKDAQIKKPDAIKKNLLAASKWIIQNT